MLAITTCGPRCLLEAIKSFPQASQEPSKGPQEAPKSLQEVPMQVGCFISMPLHLELLTWTWMPMSMQFEPLIPNDKRPSFSNRFRKALGRGAVHIKSPITLAKFLGIAANVHPIFVLLCRLRNCKGHLLCHSVLRIWTACQNVHLCLELKKLRFEHLLLWLVALKFLNIRLVASSPCKKPMATAALGAPFGCSFPRPGSAACQPFNAAIVVCATVDFEEIFQASSTTENNWRSWASGTRVHLRWAWSAFCALWSPLEAEPSRRRRREAGRSRSIPTAGTSCLNISFKAIATDFTVLEA